MDQKQICFDNTTGKPQTVSRLMKSHRPFSRNLIFLSCFLSSACVALGTGQPQTDQDEEVSLRESETGSPCVMVFARVGERFHYDLRSEERTEKVKVEAGSDATGALSHLPTGLALDAENLALSGVPQRAGFHEFVLRENIGGRVQERIVLIDIQGHGFAAGLGDYASYFAGGVR